MQLPRFYEGPKFNMGDMVLHIDLTKATHYYNRVIAQQERGGQFPKEWAEAFERDCGALRRALSIQKSDDQFDAICKRLNEPIPVGAAGHNLIANDVASSSVSQTEARRRPDGDQKD